MPKQNRYNLPMEIFYTIVPFIIVGVLFYFTILAQNKVLAKAAEPDVTIDVVGQKWSWTFNYKEADNPAVGSGRLEAGTINKTPDLYLPVDKSVRFNLSSPDVIHSFWVPAFYQKLDVVPGRNNSFDMTPTRRARSRASAPSCAAPTTRRCCSTSHVVSEEEYNAYLKTLIAKGQIGEAKGPPTPTSRRRPAAAEEEENAMTTLQRTAAATEIADADPPARHDLWKWMTTTDHKVIGNLYFITSMMFFFFGGILALAIRAELAFPGLQYLSYETYNQFFTMHGAIMLLLFATPLFAGFANAIMPLQIGSPDVAFPRLNMFSYWLVPVRRADGLLRASSPRTARPASAGTRTCR